MTKIFCDHCGREITELPCTEIRDGYLPEGPFKREKIGVGKVLCDDCAELRNELHAELDRYFLVENVNMTGVCAMVKIRHDDFTE